MKTKLFYAGLVALLTLSFTQEASAATSVYVNTRTPIYAGPDPYYPSLLNLRRGSTVRLYGCLTHNDWCEISTGTARGWVPGAYLDVIDRRRHVRLVDAGTLVTVPVVSFSIESYWDTHYRKRSFYKDRDRWYRRGGDRDRDWDRNDRGRGHDRDDHRGRGHDKDNDGRDDHRLPWRH